MMNRRAGNSWKRSLVILAMIARRLSDAWKVVQVETISK